MPKLRSRWEPHRTAPGELFTAQERNAIWEHAARTAAEASAQIHSLAATSPGDAADAAWAAADTLHTAAAALGSRVLHRAADSYDRAARAPYARIPRPTPAGNSLRQTARLLARVAVVSGDSTLAQVTLITRLAALAESVAELRHAQRHAAQAAAARRAAEHLHAVTRDHRRSRPATATERVRLDFQVPPPLSRPRSPSHGTDRAARPGPRPSHAPRGPTR